MSGKRAVMLRIRHIRPEYVAHLPEDLAEGVLYVCDEFKLAAHRCCCGCGEEVITPLNEAQWSVIRRGSEISLWPSVGNWNFACRSHYWIRANRVFEAPSMTAAEIQRVRQRDRRDKDLYIRQMNDEGQQQGRSKRGWMGIAQGLLSRLRAFWSR